MARSVGIVNRTTATKNSRYEGNNGGDVGPDGAVAISTRSVTTGIAAGIVDSAGLPNGS